MRLARRSQTQVWLVELVFHWPVGHVTTRTRHGVEKKRALTQVNGWRESLCNINLVSTGAYRIWCSLTDSPLLFPNLAQQEHSYHND